MAAVTSITAPDAAPRPRPRGGAGTLISAGDIHDTDQNSALRGDKWYGRPGKIGVASQMMRDPHVRKSVDAITAPIMAAIWDFKPASPDPVDMEIADFCRWVFFECNPWTQVIRQALNYIRDGFSLLEVTDDVAPVPAARFPNHPGNGKGIVITGFHYRPSYTVEMWGQSKKNPTQLDNVIQYIQGSDVETLGFRKIPANRVIRFTFEQEGANFAGLAPLRSAYGAFKTKRLLLVLSGIRQERQSCGTPTLYLSENATDEEVDRAEQILAELRSHEKGYVILPHGYKFEWTTSGSADTKIEECIRMANEDIAHNMGAAWLLLGLGSSSGSYALANTQRGQYELGVESHARFLTDTLNSGPDGWSAIERLVRLNYGEDRPLPQIVARNLPTRDWSKSLPIVHNLGTSGFLTPDEPTEAFIREALFLPPRNPDTERRPVNSAPAAEIDTTEDEARE